MRTKKGQVKINCTINVEFKDYKGKQLKYPNFKRALLAALKKHFEHLVTTARGVNLLSTVYMEDKNGR